MASRAGSQPSCAGVIGYYVIQPCAPAVPYVAAWPHGRRGMLSFNPQEIFGVGLMVSWTCHHKAMPRSEETVPLLEFLPLNDVPNVILNRICQVLWRWEDCLGCESEADCGCHRKRDEEFGPFDKFYKTVTFWSGAEICGDGPALRNHDDLLKIISVIKANPSSPKKSLVVEFFADYGEAMPGDKDQQRAFNLALTVMTMARCSLKGPVCRDWPRGFAPVDWGMGDSALDFIKMAIPQVEPLRMGTTDGLLGVSELMASHLEDCGMTLEGTSDLRRHLYFDTTSGTLYIFHYAGFLKAWLKETRGVPNQTSVGRTESVILLF